MRDENGKTHPIYTLDISMMMDDIEDRERDLPAAPQCQECKRECKVHALPKVKFECYQEEK